MPLPSGPVVSEDVLGTLRLEMCGCIFFLGGGEKSRLKNINLESLKLVKNVAWVNAGASTPACDMAVANPSIRAGEIANAEQQCHMVQLLSAYVPAQAVLLDAGQ